jgi:hypothetical protein
LTTQQERRVASKADITAEEEAALGLTLDETGEDNILSAADLGVPKSDTPDGGAADGLARVVAVGHAALRRGRAGPDGNPMVHGLRRVARLLLGPVLYSGAHVCQAPSYAPGFEKLGILQPAVVSYTVKILMCRPDDPWSRYEVTFKDAADVYFGNTDPDYARHATATAATRAEARCLRKALQLKSVAAEEKTLVPTFEAAQDGMIIPTQVNFLNVLCHRNNINVMKFVNMGKTKYDRVEDIPYGTAALMVEHLSGFQNDPTKVPDAIRGYDKNWSSRSEDASEGLPESDHRTTRPRSRRTCSRPWPRPTRCSARRSAGSARPGHRPGVADGHRVKGKKVETFEFPEYHCQNPQCRARLSLGTINDDRHPVPASGG